MEIRTLTNLPGDQQIALEAVQNRAKEKDWYVLKYDMRTTEYNNEIVFKTMEEAYQEFLATESNYPEERIELIFAPSLDDPEFGDNIVVNYKLYKGGERFTELEKKKFSYFDYIITTECELSNPSKVIKLLLEDGFTEEELIEMSFSKNTIERILKEE